MVVRGACIYPPGAAALKPYTGTCGQFRIVLSTCSHPMHLRSTDMEGALRALGVKLTAQRLAIVREFADDPTHPTAQELFERLRGSVDGLSVATVYNTLAMLQGAGLCRELNVQGNAARFDPATAQHNHTVCDGCGAVRDVPCGDDAPRAVVEDFAVREVEVVYRGLCAGCVTAARGGSDGLHNSH